jgi:hypothetical protein
MVQPRLKLNNASETIWQQNDPGLHITQHNEIGGRTRTTCKSACIAWRQSEKVGALIVDLRFSHGGIAGRLCDLRGEGMFAMFPLTARFSSRVPPIAFDESGGIH